MTISDQLGGLTNKMFQAVLSNAPSFTDVLTFTDEEGDDPELVDYVIALAKEKQIKINVIWTAEGLVQSALIPA